MSLNKKHSLIFSLFHHNKLQNVLLKTKSDQNNFDFVLFIILSYEWSQRLILQTYSLKTPQINNYLQLFKNITEHEKYYTSRQWGDAVLFELFFLFEFDILFIDFLKKNDLIKQKFNFFPVKFRILIFE